MIIKFLPRSFLFVLTVCACSLALYFKFNNGDYTLDPVKEVTSVEMVEGVVPENILVEKPATSNASSTVKASNDVVIDLVIDQKIIDEVSLSSRNKKKKNVVEKFDIEADLRLLGVLPSIPLSEAKAPTELDEDILPELLVGAAIDNLESISEFDVSTFEANDTAPRQGSVIVKDDDGLSDVPDVSISRDERRLLGIDR